MERKLVKKTDLIWVENVVSTLVMVFLGFLKDRLELQPEMACSFGVFVATNDFKKTELPTNET